MFNFRQHSFYGDIVWKAQNHNSWQPVKLKPDRIGKVQIAGDDNAFSGNCLFKNNFIGLAVKLVEILNMLRLQTQVFKNGDN